MPPLLRAIPPRCACAVLAALAFAAPARAADPDLTALSVESLLELRVSGASKYEQRQSEIAAAVGVVTRSDIRRFGWRTIDEALAGMPGVHVSYDRQYNYLGLRGFGQPGDFNTRLLVMLDGLRLNDAVYDSAPAGRQVPIDLDLVERIEFIPGPGGAVYGQNAMFGVLNIVTRRGAALRGVEGRAGVEEPLRLREGRLSFGQRLDSGVDLLVSVAGTRMRGEDRRFGFGDAGVEGVAAGQDGLRDREWFVRLGYDAWTFSAVRSNRRKQDPTGVFFSDPLVPGQYQGERYALVSLQYDGPADAGGMQWQGRVFAGRQDYDSRLSYGASPGQPVPEAWYAFPSTGGWRGAELRLLHTGLPGHKLMVGVELQHNHVVRQRGLQVTEPDQGWTIDSPGRRAGVFLQDEWQLAPALRATLGVRWDRNSGDAARSSPRLGLIWQPAPDRTLKALLGRAHRAPNAYERDYGDSVTQMPNPALAGERIDTVEFVADRFWPARDLLLRAAAYRWVMRNRIELGVDAGSGLPQYQTRDRVHSSGLELSAEQGWSSGVRLRGNLAWQRPQGDDGRPLENSPRHMAKTTLLWPLAGGWHAAGEWQLEGRRMARDGTSVGGRGLAHLRIGADDLAPGLVLGLGIRNLFDRRYSVPAADINWQTALEQDGRTVRLDAQFRF